MNKIATSAVAVTTLVAVGVAATAPESHVKEPKKSETVSITKAPVSKANTDTKAKPKAAEQAVESLPDDADAVTPAVDVRTEAHQKILDNGWNEENATCFDLIIDHMYNWNITETEMLHRIDTVAQTYSSYCSAWNVIQSYPTNGPGKPPGFRD